MYSISVTWSFIYYTIASVFIFRMRNCSPFHRRYIRMDWSNRSRFRFPMRILRCKHLRFPLPSQTHRKVPRYPFRIPLRFHLKHPQTKYSNVNTSFIPCHLPSSNISFSLSQCLTGTESGVEDGSGEGVDLRNGHQHQKNDYLQQVNHYFNTCWMTGELCLWIGMCSLTYRFHGWIGVVYWRSWMLRIRVANEFERG